MAQRNVRPSGLLGDIKDLKKRANSTRWVLPAVVAIGGRRPLAREML